MRDRDLYAKILNLPEPWTVVDGNLDLHAGSVLVRLGRPEGAALECPECGAVCPGWPDQIRTGWCEFRRPVRYNEVEATRTAPLYGAEA